MDLIARVRELSSPLTPIPTGQPARLSPCPSIRAVLFDVYGTLVISGSGDVGTIQRSDRSRACAAACEAVLGSVPGPPEDLIARVDAEIRAQQQRLHESGIAFPEIEIRDIWRNVLADQAPDEAGIEALAVEFECRANPVWPMPNAGRTLAALRNADQTLGIISNAQFFTSLLFPALLDGDVDELGFRHDLCFFSWQTNQAKPGVVLYERAADALRERGIAPGETLYVGNDIRNDIRPAAATGFRTALVAADQRSLRLREDDPGCQGVEPDLVVTDLWQIVSAVCPDTPSN